MLITDEALAEFKKLWKETYDEEIDGEFAHEAASQLIELLKAAYGPEEDYKL